jgi:hypothetical protein
MHQFYFQGSWFLLSDKLLKSSHFQNISQCVGDYFIQDSLENFFQMFSTPFCLDSPFPREDDPDCPLDAGGTFRNLWG